MSPTNDKKKLRLPIPVVKGEVQQLRFAAFRALTGGSDACAGAPGRTRMPV